MWSGTAAGSADPEFKVSSAITGSVLLATAIEILHDDYLTGMRRKISQN